RPHMAARPKREGAVEPQAAAPTSGGCRSAAGQPALAPSPQHRAERRDERREQGDEEYHDADRPENPLDGVPETERRDEGGEDEQHDERHTVYLVSGATRRSSSRAPTVMSVMWRQLGRRRGQRRLLCRLESRTKLR